MKAPTPDTFFEVKPKESGPLPLLPVSAVQIRLSPALNPLRPARFQLQAADGHTTAIRLFGPIRETEPVTPLVEVKEGVAVSTVASAPNCDHTIVSLAPKAPRLVTSTTLSARAAAVAISSMSTATTALLRPSLRIDGPIVRVLPPRASSLKCMAHLHRT